MNALQPPENSARRSPWTRCCGCVNVWQHGEGMLQSKCRAGMMNIIVDLLPEYKHSLTAFYYDKRTVFCRVYHFVKSLCKYVFTDLDRFI